MMKLWIQIIYEFSTLDVTYLDFNKAFDTVLHERLLKKFKGYGIIDHVLAWI